MDKKILYSSVKCQLKKLFDDEGIKLSRGFLDNLLLLMSKMCGYEEEEKKIRPQLIISHNVIEATKQVPVQYKMPASVGLRSGGDLERRIKPLLPFCNNGWFVYCDIQEKTIEYGLIRAFSGPQGLSFNEMIFEYEDIPECGFGYSLVEISTLSNFEIKVIGLLKNKLVIDFRLTRSNDGFFDYSDVAKDIVSGISEEDHRDKLELIYKNFFKMMSQRIHGTIFLIVKENYIFPNKFLSDGVWLKEPVDISEKAIDLILSNAGSAGEVFYGVTGLLLEMLNIDGITIIDEKGRIRGFNVFINQAQVREITASGGARKRAALALVESGDPGVIGVYFQSQDGNMFYMRSV